MSINGEGVKSYGFWLRANSKVPFRQLGSHILNISTFNLIYCDLDENVCKRHRF